LFCARAGDNIAVYSGRSSRLESEDSRTQSKRKVKGRAVRGREVFAGCKTIRHLIENTSTGLDQRRNCAPCVVERFSMNPLVPMFLSLLSWTGQSQSAEPVRIVNTGRHSGSNPGEKLSRAESITAIQVLVLLDASTARFGLESILPPSRVNCCYYRCRSTQHGLRAGGM
jgi:hypothetical protein